MKLIHISDPHISKDPEKNGVLQQRLGELRAHSAPDDWLVITGDVTDDGRAGQYHEATRLLAPWRGHILAVPGNHDMGPWGNVYVPAAEGRWDDWADEMGIPSQGQLPGWQVICLDSCLHTLSPLDFAQGQIGLKTLNWLSGELYRARSEGLRTIVALHHHPMHDVWAERLRDSDEFLRIVYGVADVVLFGHRHERSTWTCPRGVQTILHAEASLRAVRGDWSYSVDLG